ncbi:indole-3-glycerol phosphate synthase TrpC (plasmid) [Cytobacillus spongiae]|uniref:indole-3-glycerol phosphate synthase TrpC n=1 Tax=Cytobacillus spongiae TaxID=2901381 RepID=UPI00145E6C30|nr:indole-3-glycerol phosphate synthase TrpC [Cytobacillus spongiae]NMH70315.1 indole-3-glycerol phosphate synthase TrpC [Bacillus sp. RO3]UII58583.1 indole-3-glycerol phosphate synthase TrpC [Cytobacillus spongiae]
MSTILETIIEVKKKEVTQLKNEGYASYQHGSVPPPSLFQTLKAASRLQVIAEIKRASPSKGDIRTEVDPVVQARKYEEAGACAISVLTDSQFFKGSMEDLANVRRAVSLPILCKDFIIDEIQIDRAKDAGANVILLIVAALENERLRELYSYAATCDLEVLVEVHHAEEMKAAIELGANMIGVNNRNLKTFEVDLHATEELGTMIKGKDVVFISESGIRNEDDCTRAVNAGANGVLVGETLMRSHDPAAKLKSLQVSKGVAK